MPPWLKHVPLRRRTPQKTQPFQDNSLIDKTNFAECLFYMAVSQLAAANSEQDDDAHNDEGEIQPQLDLVSRRYFILNLPHSHEVRGFL